MDKEKQTSSAYDIKGEENTLSTSETKEKKRYGYVLIYEYDKKSALQPLKLYAQHSQRPSVR